MKIKKLTKFVIWKSKSNLHQLKCSNWLFELMSFVCVIECKLTG